MKIQFCSDLHLEFDENTSYLKENQLKPEGEYLVLSGDISYMTRIAKEDRWFFEWCADNFEHTWYVPGNHEFYDRTDISILNQPFKEKIKSNVSFVNNIIENINGQSLIFTPLFSKISHVDSIVIRFCMNDFHRIFYQGKRLTVDSYNSINKTCLDFLWESLAATQNKIHIFSHHVPLKKCISKEDADSPLNEAFANNLEDLILKYKDKINHWIFGHSHNFVGLYEGNTLCLANPLGYVWEGENKNFNQASVINI